jgi:hypothetical protein
LKDTVVPSGKAVPNAIPRDEEATIKGMETAGMEGVEAGAEGLPRNPATQPGAQRSIPEPFRSAIVTNADVHVP